MQTNDRNSRVCPECFEPEHPQKYPKIKAGDPKPLPFARPDPEDSANPTYTCANTSIAATGGSVTFTVVKTARLDLASTLYWRTISANAWDGRDFVKANGTLNWAISDVNKTFNVTVNNVSPLSSQRVFQVGLYESTTSQIPVLIAVCVIG
jgi:hypothetical protein